MPVLVADCPRCGAQKMTFLLMSHIPIDPRYRWQQRCEAFCICRGCHRSTVFVLRQVEVKQKEWIHDVGSAESLAGMVDIEGTVTMKDKATQKPPDHVPENIECAFSEGATCVAVGCHNAACCMFRLCIDLATKELLPSEKLEGLNEKTRRDLGLRLPWLFANEKLPGDLQGLSVCVKDYGNDGAHEGVATEEDARDMLDFTALLLERLYTEPKRIEIATRRGKERRKAK